MAIRRFVITKKIARQGNKAIICIPTFLHDELKPSTVVKVTIDIVKEAEK